MKKVILLSVMLVASMAIREGTEEGVCHYCNGECGWTEGCEDVQRDEVHRDGG